MPIGSPSPKAVDVFIVDADAGQRRSLAGLINERALGRFQTHVCADASEALTAARDEPGAILIADIDTVGGTGPLAEIARTAPLLIATSRTSSLNLAVAAVKAGAIDFLPKPIGAKHLMERLETAVTAWRSDRPQADPFPRPAAAGPAPAAAAPQAGDFAGFIGRSPAMAAVYEQVGRIARSRAPVFITGESGTGKEVCAEAIHLSAGGERPFVALNCSAIPRDLIESEIFGHMRGAFTGAVENRAGAAELADGGTLFLDEIAEMDLALQAKLLRFVQTGTFRRVGGTELKRVDVRIVAATNRDPAAEAEAGRFRADLLYRLNVLPIHLPPLRERGDDIRLLAEGFLARYGAEEGRRFTGFDAAAMASLLAHAWPGNVRELQNVVRRIAVLHGGGAVTPAMLPPMPAAKGIATPALQPAAAGRPAILPFREQERQIIESAIATFGGNVPRAAAALELSPSTLYRKLQAWTGGAAD